MKAQRLQKIAACTYRQNSRTSKREQVCQPRVTMTAAAPRQPPLLRAGHSLLHMATQGQSRAEGTVRLQSVKSLVRIMAFRASWGNIVQLSLIKGRNQAVWKENILRDSLSTERDREDSAAVHAEIKLILSAPSRPSEPTGHLCLGVL